MRVYFYLSELQRKEYNIRLLQLLCAKYNVAVTDSADDADCVWVSLCDIVDLPILFQAKKLKKPIVVGGSIAHLPVLRMLADYVCVGEGYHFVEAFSKCKTLSDIEKIEEVSTRDKVGTPNEFIDYKFNPIVQVTNQGYYYYTGKGCPQKCKFCLMSYTREWQTAPEAYIINALKSIPSKGKLYTMSSYFSYQHIPRELCRKLGVQDAKVKEYVRTNGEGIGHRIRVGIEFADEKLRKGLAKPILDHDISEFIRITKEHKCEATVYFVGGLENTEQINSFLSKWPEDGSLSPRLILIFTYIDPQWPTPMGDFDIRNKIAINTDRIFQVAQSHNRRIRVHKAKYIAHSSWRTIMQRASTIDEAMFAWGLRNCKDNDLLLRSTERQYPHLLGTADLGQILSRPRIAIQPGKDRR